MSDQPLPHGDPASLGFDPDRLASLQPAMEAFADSKRVPNLVTLVARRGQIVHFHACGKLALAADAPCGKDAIFRLYSNTKPISGVATLILYERGILTPDDPVAKFLPEFANQRVMNPFEPAGMRRPKRPMTIRDCLTNTTSLCPPDLMPSFYRRQYRDALETAGVIQSDNGERERPTNRDRVRALAEIPLADDPGERFVYHLGYPILSAVLEEAAGQTLDVFYRENIFDPLQMTSTDFYLKEGCLDRFTACYSPRQVDGVMKLVETESAANSEKNIGPRTEFGGGGDQGGVLSTAGDYARFGQMLLNGGELDGVRILGRKTVDMMVGNHTGDMTIPMTGPGFHWGLGVAQYHGRGRFPLIRSVGTYGWDGAAGTNYFADPKEELLCVCFTQVLGRGLMPNNTYTEDFQRIVYQSLC